MDEFRQVEISKIDDPEVATRIDIDDQKLDELAKDIRDNGLYYPVIVKPVGDRFEVVDGHRRTLACRRLGLVEITCKVLPREGPPPEAVKLKTNLLREQNNDAELAVYLGELVDKHGYNMEQLMQVTGMSENWINERYALLQGDHDVLTALNEGKINFTHAKVLNKCPDKAWRDLGLHYAIADHIPATKLNDWLVRNTPNPTATADLSPAQPQPSVEAPVIPASGVRCDWCGGDKDPYNMVFVTLHRWEWEFVQNILRKASEQQQ